MAKKNAGGASRSEVTAKNKTPARPAAGATKSATKAHAAAGVKRAAKAHATKGAVAKKTLGKASSGAGAVRVRMYRQGLGDCFLVSLPKGGGGDFFILIDCGVILGTPNPAELMKAVVADIVATTNNH